MAKMWPVTPRSAASAVVTREVRASVAQEMRWRGSAISLVNRVYRLRGRLSPDALREALATVTARHEALRCSLHHDGELRMRVYRTVPTALSCIAAQGRTLAEREAWLGAWVTEEIGRPFERGEPPLVRATLARLDEEDHVFVLVIDHIISDGWSVELLAREISEAYRAAIGEEAALPADVHQYPGWVAQQRAALTEERLAARTAFWAAKFPGGPVDTAVWLSGYRAPGAAVQGRAGIIEATLGEDATSGLRQAARDLQVTLYVLTATVLVRLLQKEAGQERITLSTSAASRFSPQTASMIGYLATTIWVPTTLAGAGDLRTAVRAFQHDLLDAMAKSDVPARMVFERLWGPEARALMDAVPQAGFLCTPFWGESLAFPGIDVEATEIDDGSADCTLSFYLTDRGSRIEVQERFVPEALEHRYACGLLDSYLADLQAVAAQAG